MRRSGVALLLAAFALCCSKESNPVLPTDPGPTSGRQLSVSVTSDVNQLNAGSTAATIVRVSARYSDSTLPADGTEVTLNTNLGSFGNDSAGKPVQLTKATLTGGVASVQFFPGTQTGTANILASIGTTVGTLNLQIVTAPATPVADFSFAVNGLAVLFTDASTGSPVSRRWQFGDGTESTDVNPAHTYLTASTYTVTLTVTNSAGQSNKSKFVTVSVGKAPLAAFDVEVIAHDAHFVDRSTENPTSWSWDFGDGSGSGEQNPIHTFPAAGKYTVTLRATNAAGSNSISQVVTVTPSPPVAAFDYLAAGTKVNFVDQSTNTPTSWRWQFGDGFESREQNPIHTYGSAGIYTVTLTATNADGSNSVSKVVKAEPAPVSAFTYEVAGAKVTFTDKSSNSPTSWAWSFGDGATATEQNPIHTYAASGNYAVTLTVSNVAGSSSSTQTVPVTAGTLPKAAFSYEADHLVVNFTDNSTGTPTQWFWNFGDGRTSGLQNPTHTYTAGGTYNVTLLVTNSAGSNSVTQSVKVVP